MVLLTNIGHCQETHAYLNLGVSTYCKFSNKKILPMTNKFANQILMDILSSENNSDSTLLKYSKNIKSNIRAHAKYLQHGDVFSKVKRSNFRRLYVTEGLKYYCSGEQMYLWPNRKIEQEIKMTPGFLGGHYFVFSLTKPYLT